MTILDDIMTERLRQESKFQDLHDQGYGVHLPKLMPDAHRVVVLVEEVGEVARASHDGDREELRRELVQVAAVCVAWLEGLDDTTTDPRD